MVQNVMKLEAAPPIVTSYQLGLPQPHAALKKTTNKMQGKMGSVGSSAEANGGICPGATPNRERGTGEKKKRLRNDANQMQEDLPNSAGSL